MAKISLDQPLDSYVGQSIEDHYKAVLMVPQMRELLKQAWGYMNDRLIELRHLPPDWPERKQVENWISVTGAILRDG